MDKFKEFSLMSIDDAKEYAVNVLHKFAPDEPTDCIEIGDGNINYVYKIVSKSDGRSVIIKQADKFLRSSGRPLDIYRNKLEATALQIESELVPGYVPEIFKYDEVMSATSMEDISEYGNLRKELMANRIYPHLAESISTFLAKSLLPTTDLVMNSAEKKKLVHFFYNPEMCDISEDLVFTEPYLETPVLERNKNIIFPGNEEFVKENLYNDDELKAEVGVLLNRFKNFAQALVHGDLHSGSIFANEKGIKVLDPEFAFYGPMGYDIGNVIGNLIFSWANKAYTAPENAESLEKISKLVADVFDLTMVKISGLYDELVTFPHYRESTFKNCQMKMIMSDSVGYAATEIIRRTVGDSKVMEITSVENPELRIPMERTLITAGIKMIKNRACYEKGSQIVDLFNEVLAQYR